MTVTTRRVELREFLHTRRRALSPEELGLPRGRRRRITGLRREELAAVADVGVTWYTWLEQGRNIRVSAETLMRIARALRLSPTDTTYLFTLCELSPPQAATGDTQIPQPILDVLSSFQGPAIVMAPTLDVLASNAFADALYDFDAFPGRFARNILARALLDPVRRRLYINFRESLPNMIGFFRMAYARHVGEPRFEDVRTTLMEQSPEFAEWWHEQQTALPKPVLLHLQSDKFGRLDLSSTRFTIPGMPDHLLVLLPPANDRTRQIVARWFSQQERCGCERERATDASSSRMSAIT
ncbi:MAG: helix-turn-helix transcriptional regulator [bacterium]